MSKAAAMGALRAARDESTVAGVFRRMVDYAKNTLEQTPEMLPKLKEAGVVDAGGAGLVYILEGMLYYLERGEVIRREAAVAAEEPAKRPVAAGLAPEEITFGYCTEFIIEKKSDAGFCEDFKKQIAPLGDCMLVIDDFEVVKVHIHTDHPGQVLEAALELGALNDIKIDNMQLSAQRTHSGKQGSGTAGCTAPPLCHCIGGVGRWVGAYHAGDGRRLYH